MQYDLEQDMPTISRPPENLHKAGHEELSLGKEYFSQATELLDQGRLPYASNHRASPGEIALEVQIRDQRETRRRQRFSPTTWRFALMIGDGVLLGTSMALVLLFVPYLHLEPRVSNFALGLWHSRLLWICLALISWATAVRITQAQELARLSSSLESPLRVLCALALTLIFWTALTYPFVTDRVAYLRVLLFFLVLAAPTSSVWRVIFAKAISLPRFRLQAVIVGTNTAGETIARELHNAKQPGVNVLGYINENTDEESQQDGLPVLGGRNTLRRLAQGGKIDTIIMAIDCHANPELFQEAIEATQIGISVVPMTTVYESVSGKVPIEHLMDQWYIGLPSASLLSPLYLGWRKVMDIIFGLVGMVALILVLPVVAALIYLESPGPIFYSQERLGYQRRKFYIHKFRTMGTDAEPAGRAVWTIEHDARVTQVGRFLRATHLDELPQVLNILRGEMSLIGPRPERQAFVTELEKTIPFYACRLAVKPGLTGWAQVQSGYASSEQKTLLKLQYDLYYIKHQSFIFDMLIILKTLSEVLLCRGT